MNAAHDDITIYCGRELGGELQACIEVIKEGDAVDVDAAAAELPKALFVAVKRDVGAVVGVAAIKRQRPWYAKDKALKSGFTFDENLHELGYVSVRKTHRKQGLASALLNRLLSACKIRPLFATTSNETMKKRFSEAGFQKCGNEWRGNDSMLSLWIKG